MISYLTNDVIHVFLLYQTVTLKLVYHEIVNFLITELVD